MTSHKSHPTRPEREHSPFLDAAECNGPAGCDHVGTGALVFHRLGLQSNEQVPYRSFPASQANLSQYLRIQIGRAVENPNSIERDLAALSPIARIIRDSKRVQISRMFA